MAMKTSISFDPGWDLFFFPAQNAITEDPAPHLRRTATRIVFFFSIVVVVVDRPPVEKGDRGFLVRLAFLFV